MSTIVDKAEIEAAGRRIKRFLPPTPILYSRHFSARTGAQIFLKLETFQPTHSFKVRGAFNAALALPEEQRNRGVITASAGSHGLGVALAAATLGFPASIYLPTSTPKVKVEAIRKLGAEITLYGNVWDEANQQAMQMAKNDGKTYIHPFDHVHVMAGQGTIVCELIKQIPKIDLIVASIGGGGLISGLLSAAKHFTPATRVVGVETQGADCMYQSRKAGRIVELPAITSVAESLGAKKTEPMQFNIATKNAADLVVVPDEAAIRALLETLQEEKLLVEPAASCCLAALLENKIPVRPGETIVVVMCGANVAIDRVMQWQKEIGQTL